MRSLTAVAVLLMVGSVAFANNSKKDKKTTSSKVAVVQNTNQKFKLVYLEEMVGEVKVNIKNAQGSLVHSQLVENEAGFAQQYDFEKLPLGQYTFEIIRPDGAKIIKKVQHKAAIAQAEIKGHVLDVNDNKKFRLAVVKYNDQPVDINIYNDQNELIHSETVRSKDSFRKTFDLIEAEGDNFRFDLKNKNSTISVSAG
ncbi:MAG: hypothetical protein AAGA02_15470 [Bacteroidota bacterium]